MAWVSGVFSRLHNWINDRDANIKILATRHDAEDDNLSAGINNTLTKDGQNTATANLPMGNFRHTGVGNASARTDYVSAAQIQDSGVVYVADTGTADVYAIALSPAITAYVTGNLFWFKAANTNTGASTLNVSGVGAKSIVKTVSTALIPGDIKANGVYSVIYDGTNFQLISDLDNGVNALDRDVTVTEVVNTTVETNVYSFTVVGGTLGTDRMLRLTLAGDYLNNSGGAPETFDVRVKYGATTIISLNLSIVSSTIRRPFVGEITLSALNATNVQISVGALDVLILQDATLGTAGEESLGRGMKNNIAEDSTVNQNLVVSFQHATANANISGRLHTAHLELV